MDAESPHILVNASTGGGKSVTLRCITCQMVHRGSLAFILDYKQISHPWARGVPGITYCAAIADIHEAWRSSAWKAGAGSGSGSPTNSGWTPTRTTSAPGC